MLPVEEPQGNLNAPEKGEQITEQPNQVEFDTPHIEEQTANHDPKEGDPTPTTTGGGGEPTVHTPPSITEGGKPTTKRSRKKASVKWSVTDYEHAKDEKHMIRSVELDVQGEKYTPRPSAVRYRGDAAHLYSFVYEDNVNLFTYTVEGGSEPESGYESNDEVGPTFEEQQKQSWQSLHKGRGAVRLHIPDSTHMRGKTEILANLVGDSQEKSNDDFWETEDDEEQYEMTRGPTPRCLIQMSTIATVTDMMHIGNKGGDRPKRTEPPMIFNGSYNGIPCKMMYDTGAGTSVVCPQFVKYHSIEQVPSSNPIRLRYGSGETSDTHQETKEANLSVGEVKFKDTFYLNPTPLKVVDVILGLSFISRERTEQRFPPSDNGANKPYVQFPSGAKMYTMDDILGSTTVDCNLVSITEAADFLKQEQRRNGNLQDVESFVVSVTKEMQLSGDISATDAEQKPVHPDIKKLMDKRDIFRTEVPIGEIMDREIKMTHKIPIKQGEEPVKIRPIPVSGPKLAVLQALVKNLLEAGVIEKGNINSEWGAPVLLLRKGGTRAGLTNSWRIVCDFRQLNAKSQKLTWTPPNVREILDDLQGHKYFSKTDAVGGFYQLELEESDREKTTFRIKNERGGMDAYRFRVSCLGLQGCPHSYQNFMERVVEGLKNTYVYLDDVVIASKTWEEHLLQLDAYFARCEEYKVFLHPLKCEFGVEEIEYLGLKVSKNRIQISDDKIAAVKAYNRPDSYPALHRFLGFANYLACFIQHHAEKTAPLSDLLKGGDKKKKFIWNQACESSFLQIKQNLIDAVGLGIPDKDGDLVVETDASGVACGAVLYQFTDNRLVPLWYLSKKLNKHEKNYSARDREALAVCWALSKLQSYLHLKPFVLYSDHQSLIYLKTQKEIKTSRDYRWMEIISQYDFEQRYRKGELMTVPDALSRAFDDRADSQGVWKDMEHTCRTEIEPLINVLNAKQAADTDISMVIPEHGHYPHGMDVTSMVHEQLQDLYEPYLPATGTKQQKKDTETLHETWLHPCVATKVFGDLGSAVQRAYPEDPNFRDIYAASKKALADMSEKEKTLSRNFTFDDGYLLHNKEGVLGNGRICIPRTEGNGLRLTILYEAHESVLHGGFDKTYTRVSNQYWWPTMHRDCKNYVRSCHACRRFASVQSRPGGAKESHDIPEGRFETICADFITDLPKTSRGYDTILAVHDKVTKYAHLIPACKNDTAEETAERMFTHIFSQHGLPRCLMSDRDHLFTATFFAQLMRIVGVQQKMGTSYHHDYNGAAERLNRTVEVMLRHIVGDYPDRDFDTQLPLIQWAYNTSIHKAIGTTPYYALYGHDPRQPLDMPNLADREKATNEHLGIEGFVTHQQDVLKQVRDALLAAQMTMDEHANKNTRNAEELQIGDKVYLSTRNLGKTHLKTTVEKLQEKFIGPYEILEKRSRYTYKLKLPKKMGRLHPVFHVSLLWKEIERLPELVVEPQQPPANLQGQGGDPPNPQPEVAGLPPIPDAAPTHDAAGGHLINDEGEQLFEIEKVVDRKRVGRARSYQYLVKWVSYPDTENSWLTKNAFIGADAIALREAYDKEMEDK